MSLAPVSIVIPTLNEEKYLPKLLDSLREIDHPLDIIIVDGRSDDATAQVVENHKQFFTGDSSLRLFISDIRKPSFQRNMGAQYARHDILIFSDADTIVHPDRLSKLITQFVVEGHVVAAPRLIPIERGKRVYLTYLTGFILEKLCSINGLHGYPGSFILTRKDVFAAIKGFDADILLAEDVDYTMRASKFGTGKVFLIPVHVSARRFIKYGYGWIFREWNSILQLFRTGRIPQTIEYPFGEF